MQLDNYKAQTYKCFLIYIWNYAKTTLLLFIFIYFSKLYHKALMCYSECVQQVVPHKSWSVWWFQGIHVQFNDLTHFIRFWKNKNVSLEGEQLGWLERTQFNKYLGFYLGWYLGVSWVEPGHASSRGRAKQVVLVIWKNNINHLTEWPD